MLLEGTQVFVGPFLKKSERPDGKEQKYTNIYVKNLAETVDEPKLKETFGAHGDITSVVIMKVALSLFIHVHAFLILCLYSVSAIRNAYRPFV